MKRYSLECHLFRVTFHNDGTVKQIHIEVVSGHHISFLTLRIILVKLRFLNEQHHDLGSFLLLGAIFVSLISSIVLQDQVANMKV